MVQYPEIFDVRLRPRVITSQTGTKDLQQVTVQLRVLSHPRVEGLPEIFRSLGKDFDERVLPSICNEVLKATVVRVVVECLNAAGVGVIVPLVVTVLGLLLTRKRVRVLVVQAQFDADQLLTQRELVSRQIRETLDARSTEFNLVLDGTHRPVRRSGAALRNTPTPPSSRIRCCMLVL